LYFSSHHPEDGHMSGRNLLETTAQYNYSHKTKYMCWSFNIFYASNYCIECGIYQHTLLYLSMNDPHISSLWWSGRRCHCVGL